MIAFSHTIAHSFDPWYILFVGEGWIAKGNSLLEAFSFLYYPSKEDTHPERSETLSHGIC